MSKAYRQVTREELFKWSQALVKADQMNSLREFALTLFGDLAHTVTIEVEYEYNDEGGYDPRFTGITVCDINGVELELDFRSESSKAYLSSTWDVTYKVKHGLSPEEALKEAIQSMEEDIEERNSLLYDLADNFNVEPVGGTFYLLPNPEIPLLFVPIDVPED